MIERFELDYRKLQAMIDSSHEESRPLLISSADLALKLSVSERHIWRLVSTGKLPQPVRLGGSSRWNVRLIEEWIESGCPITNLN